MTDTIPVTMSVKIFNYLVTLVRNTFLVKTYFKN